MSTKNQNITQYFLSCDWGTTSFRLNLVELDTGKIIDKISDSDGVKKINDRRLAAESSKSRVDYFLGVLQSKISTLKKNSSKFDHLPIVVSGMASSSVGMKELPYRNLPIALEEPNLYVESIEGTTQFVHNKIYLVSGIQSHSDIMRGEGTQVLGLSSKVEINDGLLLLVGTHSKHVLVKDNSIVNFKTYLTGELFELISTHSILSNSISISEDHNSDCGIAFEKGINASMKKNLLHALFEIRANSILKNYEGTQNYNYLSGLLIGSELKDILRNKPDHIYLLANRRLQKYYSAALDILDLKYTLVDPELVENITALGHCIILKNLGNNY